VILRDPMGNPHTVPFQEIPFRHRVFRIGAPMPGTWQFEVVTLGGCGNFCIEDYLVEASIKSSLTMDLFLTTPVEERIVGTPMPILVALTDTGPITDAAVSVAITTPSGVVLPAVQLFDDGAHGDGSVKDGIYGNTFFGANMEGTYQVEAIADGTSMDFGPFHRRLKESFVMREDADIDQDRMPDGYEARVGLIVGVNDAGEDPDKDGLNNFQECSRGTDPFDPDTDDGGENDGSEVFNQPPRNPHEPGDDKVKPPQFVAVPGVANVLFDFNLPIRPSTGLIDDVTYTFEISRLVGDATEFEVYATNVQYVSDAIIYPYVDEDVDVGTTYKYQAVMVGPLGERSAPSDIVGVTPTNDPFGPVGSLSFLNGNKTTLSVVDLSLYAKDGYDPDYDFPDKDEYDPDALVSGLADMMICNKSDCSDGIWEPYTETKSNWPLQPNQSDIATVYAKFRDNAGSESDLYTASILIVDGTEPTATPTATPTEAGPTLTPTPDGTVCDVTDDDYDVNDSGEVDANDLIRLLESIKEGPFDEATDFNCDGANDMLDAFLMAEKWKFSLPGKRP
jgi:hypothetical protein